VARTLIPVKAMNRRALVVPVPTISDATNDMYFVNDGATWLEVGNVNAAGRDFTIETPYQVDLDLVIADRIFTVPGLTTVPVLVGPWPREIYGETVFVTMPALTGTDLRFYAYSLLIF
jgi:hypothetical protein